MNHPFTGRSGDDARPPRGRYEPDGNGPGLAKRLTGNGMGFPEFSPPVPSTNGNDGKFGENNGSANGGGDFLGAFDAETDVTVHIPNGDKGFETGSLTGLGLLLDGHDFHDFVCSSHSHSPIGEEREGDEPLSLGQRVSMIWYSFTGREKR